MVVTKREKRACQHCEESGVAAAAVPARIIDKSLVSDRVVIDTVVAKYSDHLPLYRQSVILEREPYGDRRLFCGNLSAPPTPENSVTRIIYIKFNSLQDIACILSVLQ